MRTLANWLVVMFMTMFWIFRVVVAFMAGNEKDFMVQPLNLTVEIIMLFISLVCIVFVIKRKVFGGLLYLLANLGYYGAYLYDSILPVIKGEQMTVANGLNTFISFLAVLLSIIVIMTLLADKTKRKTDKQTEWFFANKNLDRKMDERADKNQYKIL